MAYKAKRSRDDAGKPRTYHGKSVEDATEPLVFNVTNADIRRSKIRDPEKCAGACAIKRMHPELVAVHMHRHFTFLEYKNKVVRHKTTHALRDQLLRFDVNRNKFEPGVYKIGAVPASAIASRGKQHSAPDRAHGAVGSKHARKKAVSLGRADFRFA